MIFLFIVLVLILIIVLLYKNNRIRKVSEARQKIAAMTDELTGIANRRAAFEYLEQLTDKAKSENTDLTVCFLDINELKYVNDTYGHNEGDDLIKTVTEIILSKIRSNDIFCRLGGDEFIIIYTQAALDQASESCNRIKNDICQYNEMSTKSYKVSISMGLAEYDKTNGESIDDLIHRADDAMYEEKTIYHANVRHTKDDKKED